MRFRVVMCKVGKTELRFNIYIYIYIYIYISVCVCNKEVRQYAYFTKLKLYSNL